MKTVKRPARPRRVEVEWLDSTSHTPTWHSAAEVRDYISESHGSRIVTCGWFVDVNDHILLVALSVHTYPNGKVNQYGNLMEIPRGCIQRIRYVKAPNGSPLRS